jgi:hypothetical protein
VIPVELRYETIVIEEGKLHIYKDVYNHNANTEDILATVLSANGLSVEDLTTDERAQVLTELNAMSAHPKKQLQTIAANTNTAPTNSGGDKKSDLPRQRKSKKERVIEIEALRGKGYPAPVLKAK